MAKRPAELSLEEVSAMNSPASKKARVEDADMDPAPSSRYAEIDHREQDERRGDDILAAADQEAEELEEAAEDGPGSPDVDDEVSALSPAKRQTEPLEGYNDLYLDTINRAVLDFDFEKLCSISLSNINVYACLVCGRYFQGRGPKSYAYFHALEVGHHVYVNLETKKVYVLPEGYEVKNKSLDDIKYVVDPQYTKEEVSKLDKETKDSWDLMGKKYRPGTCGTQHSHSMQRTLLILVI
jgi:U4/U6.U5 tri-snRNP-associated protein 2